MLGLAPFERDVLYVLTARSHSEDIRGGKECTTEKQLLLVGHQNGFRGFGGPPLSLMNAQVPMSQHP